MKKLIAFCMTGILCFGMAGTVFATEINQNSDPKTADTILTTSKEASYIVVIPETAGITFDTEVNPIGDIEYIGGNLEPDAYVTVGLSSKTPLENTANSDYTIPYEVCSGNEVFEKVVYNEETEANTKIPLNVNITKEAWEKTKAGNYQARLTFSVSYTKAQENVRE